MAYLDVTAPAVQVEVQVLYLAVLAESIVDCLLIDLLVQVCHDDDPALYGAHGSGLGVRDHVVDLCLGGLGRAGLVDVHLHVGHDCLPALFAYEREVWLGSRSDSEFQLLRGLDWRREGLGFGVWGLGTGQDES